MEVIKEKVVEVPVDVIIEVPINIYYEKPIFKEVLFEEDIIVENRVTEVI